MSDKPYKNIRIKEPAFDRLTEEKREYETWDGLMHRLLNEVED